MTQMVSELYDALRAAGVNDETAKSAARAVIAAEEKDRLAMKVDVTEVRLALKADLAEMKASIIMWNLVAMGFMTALFSGLVTLLKFRP